MIAPLPEPQTNSETKSPYLRPEFSLSDADAEMAMEQQNPHWTKARLITLKIYRRAREIRKARISFEAQSQEQVRIEQPPVA